MKVVLATLNAKYIHVNLALRSIGRYCEDFNPEICEYTVNDNVDSIIASLHMKKADVIAFSCYIWNVEKVLYISQCLKKIKPSLKIILGGHEVSHDSQSIMAENPWIDYIIRGEGEKPMLSLLRAIRGNFDVENVSSLTYRRGDNIKETHLAEHGSLNEYPFAYDESIREFKGKIIYYESSRGCPFNCSYCLSGDNRRVDFLDLERVKKELLFFIENDVPLVKFVDRTFNADKERAKEIWKFIIENSKNTCFHFELAGSLIDEETIKLLKTAPKGIIQFEIGVQSTNEKTISAIGRSIEFEKVRDNVEKLLEEDNIHIHLDLIAGLPYEDYESFKTSFDEVIKVRPHVLQLGFLKLLKGSKLRNEAEKYGYKYKEKAPYEVLENSFISFDEIIKLKFIEELLERYYNSGDFTRSMNFLFEREESAFGIFEKIYDYFTQKALFDRSVSLEAHYEHLEKIFLYDGFSDCVRADRLTNKKAKLSYENEKEFKEACFEFLKKKENVEKYLSAYISLPPRKIYTKLRFEKLFGGVYLYDASQNKLTEITKDFRL